MEIEFVKTYLLELYTTGKTSDKKHRYQPHIIYKYIQTIDKLRAARNIEDLFVIKSLNYKKLDGFKSGLESVRINDQFRIEFYTSLRSNNEQIITFCRILELSNHYS